jgi:hypothetical protein
VQEKKEWRIRYNQERYQLYGHRILTERLKQQGCDGQGTYKKLAIMKYPEESLIQNSMEAGDWEGLKFGGWMAWWKI